MDVCFWECFPACAVIWVGESESHVCVREREGKNGTERQEMPSHKISP